MWLITDNKGRQLLLPRECSMVGNVLVYKDWRLPISGNLQALDPAAIEIIKASVPDAQWKDDMSGTSRA
jgi:hypothetical protein